VIFSGGLSVLEILSRGFRDVRQYLQGQRTLSEENLGEALRMIRVSLLEADVEFNIARSFLEKVKEQALGEIVQVSVKYKEKKLKVAPGDHFIKLCHDELVRLMGPEDSSLTLRTKPVSSIMMVGLQGSGKTTTAAKLAKLLIKKGKKPMLVAGDGANPPEICEKSLNEAVSKGCDVAIFDTAGRLTVDEPLMEELRQIQELTSPENVLLVCDSMIGQESVNVARAFHERIRLTGFILTKLDGDARGGAAISIKEATGLPIKFVGMGEGLDRLEEFRPDGLASRILGFGDVVGLVKDFEEVVDEKKAEEDAMRMLKGQFGFDDFLNQIKAIKKMGPLQDVIEKLPFFGGGLPASAKVDDYELVRIESIINSMTGKERKSPDLITETRIKRIAKGSGRKEDEVKDLLVKFKDMRDLMVAVGGGKVRGRWKGMKGLRKMFGGGAPAMGSDQAGFGPGNPFGLPEVRQSKATSKKALEKQRKKSKDARQARKKSKKR
jgi:signal recognition particle subunit SRP54